MKPSIDDSYRFLAARYLRRQAKRLAGELVGVRRADDVECVHQARIASRRLRAALRLFDECLPKKMVRCWRKSIRRVTTGLGTARDCDVHVEELSEMLADVKKTRGGRRARRRAQNAIAWLLVDLERKREECQPDVLREIDRIEKDGVIEEILHMCKETLVDADEGERGGRREAVYSPAVYRRVGGQILDKYQQLMALEDCLGSNKDKKRHHEMRIAAKRLRYTMEIAQPAYAGRLDESISAAKRLQSLLGDIHDRDLWSVRLAEFSRGRRAEVKKSYGDARPFAELKKGFDYLRRRCKKTREKRFRELVEFWNVLKSKGQWKELLETVQRSAAGEKSKTPAPHRSAPHVGRRPQSRCNPGARRTGAVAGT